MDAFEANKALEKIINDVRTQKNKKYERIVLRRLYKNEVLNILLYDIAKIVSMHVNVPIYLHPDQKEFMWIAEDIKVCEDMEEKQKKSENTNSRVLAYKNFIKRTKEKEYLDLIGNSKSLILSVKTKDSLDEAFDLFTYFPFANYTKEEIEKIIKILYSLDNSNLEEAEKNYIENLKEVGKEDE